MLQDSLLDSFAVRPASNRRATPMPGLLMSGHSNADILAASTVVVGLSHAVVALGVLFANYSPPARAAARIARHPHLTLTHTSTLHTNTHCHFMHIAQRVWVAPVLLSAMLVVHAK